jgi:hypothetical protein
LLEQFVCRTALLVAAVEIVKQPFLLFQSSLIFCDSGITVTAAIGAIVLVHVFAQRCLLCSVVVPRQLDSIAIGFGLGGLLRAGPDSSLAFLQTIVMILSSQENVNVTAQMMGMSQTIE